MRREARWEACWAVHTTKWECIDRAECRGHNHVGVESEMASGRGNGQGRGGRDGGTIRAAVHISAHWTGGPAQEVQEGPRSRQVLDSGMQGRACGRSTKVGRFTSNIDYFGGAVLKLNVSCIFPSAALSIFICLTPAGVCGYTDLFKKIILFMYF